MRKRASRANIFKRFWHMTGGGALNAFLISLSLLCIVLLAAIGIWSNSHPDASENSDAANVAAQEEGAEAPATDEDEDGWIEDLDDGDSTSIGNRINTAQLPDSSFIYDVSIEELANADSYLDGQTVQVTGEVVGDRITSESNPKRCWITLQSQDPDDNEVSVYMSMNSTNAIDTYGSYDKKGTTLQVRGTFYLASEDHQGASVIHADYVSIVSPGMVIEDDGDPRKMQTGLALILAGCLLMILFNILRERQR